ncbi:MAG TPA: SH3 domain-containing protein [Alphaproteobacteria bacterium]|nr:SH3 domain-containing protein [Alphaproteobacteria bacterium]
MLALRRSNSIRRAPALATAAAIALAAGITAVPGGAAAQSFRPFDEGSRDRSFAGFRRALIKIVDARNLKALQRHFHKDIRVGFGGQNGRAEAAKAMRGDPARWATLARILRRGGRFERTKWQCRTKSGPKPCILPGFIAPYTYYANPPKGRDAFETMVITASGVNVRADPRRSAKVVARLSHRIVTTPKTPRKNVSPKNVLRDWVEIELPGGKRGFVARRFAVSPIDYRAGFVKEGGRWQMTFFLAGD